MRRPYFYIGFFYLFTLVILAQTELVFAAVTGVISFAGAAVSVTLDVVRKRRGEKAQNVIISAAFAMALFASVSFYMKTVTVYEPALELADESCSFSGIVLETLTDSDSGAHRCIIKVLSSENEEIEGTKVRFSSKDYDLDVNDCVSMTAEMYALGSDSDEMKEYYKSKEMYLGCYNAENLQITDMKYSDIGEFYRRWRGAVAWANGIREYVTGSVSRYLPAEYAGVLNGMLVGDKSRIDDSTKEELKRAGILHLLAVSGFHVSLWSNILYRRLLRMCTPRPAACGIPLLFIGTFVLVTGFAVSAVRAGIMSALFYIGKMFAFESDSLNSLGIAVLLIAFANPFSGGDSGFLLSVFATMGISLTYSSNRKKLNSILRRLPDYKIRTKLQEMLEIITVSLTAFIFTFPITVLTFGTVSVIGPVTNLLVSSLCSSAILAAGISAAVSSIPVISLYSNWGFLISGLIVKYTLFVCKALSSFEWSCINADKDYIRLAVASCMILAAVTAAIRHKSEGAVRLACLLGACITLASALSAGILERNTVKIIFPEVGNGSCVIVAENGTASVIGCGGSYNCAYKAQTALEDAGVSHLNAVIAPRDKETETAGIEELASEFSGAGIIDISRAGNGRVNLASDISLDCSFTEQQPAALLNARGLRILLVFAPGADINQILTAYGKADVIYVRSDIPAGLNCSDVSFIIVSKEKGKAVSDTGKSGNVIYTCPDGVSLMIRDSKMSLRRLKS